MALSAEQLSLAPYEEVLRVKTRHGGYVAQYECRDDPRVGILVSRPTRLERRSVVLLVGRRVFPRGDWRAAAAHLAELEHG